MSNRLFQGVVHQMRDTIGRVIGVIDENSTIVACSELSRIGTNSDFFSIELGDSHDVFIRDGYTYKPFGVHVKPDYAVFIEGTDDQAAKYASILAISLSSIKQYYDEKYDRNNFVKNIILDNVLPGDITLKARELHFNADISRVVFLISIVSANEVSAYDVIQNLFPDKNKDFVFNITETEIVLVKEIKAGIDNKDLERHFLFLLCMVIRHHKKFPTHIIQNFFPAVKREFTQKTAMTVDKVYILEYDTKKCTENTSKSDERESNRQIPPQESPER